ncbi:MAG: hypothetical protein NTZ43_03440 [Gemmatimonadetes bacterium]|nr:hypothetical protein [Gemmatimonadota bacterium]
MPYTVSGGIALCSNHPQPTIGCDPGSECANGNRQQQKRDQNLDQRKTGTAHGVHARSLGAAADPSITH